MTSTPASNADVVALRRCIDEFINTRLQDRLAKLDSETIEESKRLARRARLQLDHQRDVWLGEAAKQARQLQIATHVVKFSHPSAGATNIYCANGAETFAPFVCSAGERLTDDMAVRDAKALSTYTLLKIEHDGRTLLERALRRDVAFLAALSNDNDTAEAWCNAFAAIAEDHARPASHTLAKQIYFPLGDGGYHLLSPLYPTALAQRVFESVEHVLYSDETKVGRKARKAMNANLGYREFLNVAACKFGGNNKQNVSYLNSKRGGTGYLLASCPPQWQHQGLKPPLRVETLFDRWLSGFRSLRELTQGLAKFLSGTRHNNLAIRQTRARFVAQIVDEVLHLARTLQQLPAGWSTADDCRLNQAEALWLDPGRCVTDESFAAARDNSDWPDTIARKFANWLNHEIRSDRLPVDDASALQWHRDFAQEMSGFQREIADDR